MEDSDDDRKTHNHQHEFEQLERLLTPVQRPHRHPLMAPSSAPAGAHPHPHAYGHAPFVSPASVAELYGLTPQSVATKLPDLNLPALSLPATLATSTKPAVSGAEALVEDALRYVISREQAALEQLLALSPRPVRATASAKLHRALRVRATGGGNGVADARGRVERALGRWVVHEHVPRVVPYDPASVEGSVVNRARAMNNSVYEEFRESIRAHAESQKEALKVELDARRVALAGILNDKHAKAVNNQKSAHLSKFLAAQITAATDLLVQWLITKLYN